MTLRTEPARGEPDIARIATAFADPRRVRVLMALADGRALPAGRLAEEAGVAASTISNHLAVLLDHELVTVQQQGRNRYYRLASNRCFELGWITRGAVPRSIRITQKGQDELVALTAPRR